MIKIVAATLFLTVTFIGLYLGFQNYYQKNSSVAPSPQRRISLGVATASGELSGLIYVAADQKLFEKHKIMVDIQKRFIGTDVQKDLKEDKLELGTAADFGFVADSFETDKLKVIATLDNADFIRIIGKKNNQINTHNDIKGKKIGVTQKTNAEYFLKRFLSYQGIDKSEVNFIYLAPAQIISQLNNNEIDLAVLPDPFATQLQASLGSNQVSWSIQNEQFLHWLLLANQQTINSKSDEITAVLSALLEAEQFIKSDPEKSQVIIATWTNKEPSYINSVWSKHQFALTLDQSLLLVLEDEARWRVEGKLTANQKVPNYLDYLYIDALLKVKPQAVTIIR